MTHMVSMYALDNTQGGGLLACHANCLLHVQSLLEGNAAQDTTQLLSIFGVGLSALCLLVPVGISLHQSLGLHMQLTVSAVRMVLQLMLLGIILVPLFYYSRWWMVLLYVIFMTCVAALEAGQRPARRYQGQYLHTLFAMCLGSWTLILYTSLVVLQLSPPWDAQSVIPILGMLLGNATSGVSVGLNTALQELASSKEYIELLLSLGANRMEATKSVVREALTNAMLPTINMMAVMGLVSIPGMMTGQILAGADPSDASRYQMMMVFLISGSTGMAAMVAVYLAVWHVVDEDSHYRPDRILPRKTATETWRLGARRVRMALGRTKDLCLTCLCCVTPSSISSSWSKRHPPAPRYETMFDLGDEGEDEEEGLRGDAASQQALIPNPTLSRGQANGNYHRTGPNDASYAKLDPRSMGVPSVNGSPSVVNNSPLEQGGRGAAVDGGRALHDSGNFKTLWKQIPI